MKHFKMYVIGIVLAFILPLVHVGILELQTNLKSSNDSNHEVNDYRFGNDIVVDSYGPSEASIYWYKFTIVDYFIECLITFAVFITIFFLYHSYRTHKLR